MPLIIADFFLIGMYCLILWSTSSFFCGKPCIIYAFCFCSYVSSPVAACMSSMDVHTALYTDMQIALKVKFIPVISWSVYSLWLFRDSQSTMYKSGWGLYMMCTLYWCIHSIMHYNCWGSVATSLLNIANKGFWSVMMHTSLMKK